MGRCDVILTLGPQAVSTVVSVATFHTLRCILRKAKPKNNQPEHQRLEDTLAGYLPEAAAAEAFGVEWPQPHTLEWEGRKKGDLIVRGKPIEVKGTKGPTHTHLLIQKDEPADRYYVLVIPVEGFTFDVAGYIKGSRGKNEDYWQERVGQRPCYWVPRRDLAEIKS